MIPPASVMVFHIVDVDQTIRRISGHKDQAGGVSLRMTSAARVGRSFEIPVAIRAINPIEQGTDNHDAISGRT